jgi:hypothetical protein
MQYDASSNVAPRTLDSRAVRSRPRAASSASAQQGDATSRLRIACAVRILAIGLAVSPPVLAQIPPNAPPGTVCVTPQSWCSVQPAGPPGALCFCPSPRGPVQGILR